MYNLEPIEVSNNNNTGYQAIEGNISTLPQGCDLPTLAVSCNDDLISPGLADYNRLQVVFLAEGYNLTGSEELALEHHCAIPQRVQNFSQLVSWVSSASIGPAAICIHLGTLTILDGIDIIEAIDVLRTLCRCKPHCNHPTALAVMVDKDTEQKVLKQLTTLDIQALVTDDIRNDLAELENCFGRLLANSTYRSPNFIKRLHAKLRSQRREDPNQVRLTVRQDQIMRLICTRGASNKVIARLLDISESTVKLHVSAIFKKFGVKNRTQLALFSKNMHVT